MNHYEVLKDRLESGVPFLKATAITRIDKLADELLITQEQAEELKTLANQNGVDDLGRPVEEVISEMKAAVAEMKTVVEQHDEAIVEIAEMVASVPGAVSEA